MIDIDEEEQWWLRMDSNPTDWQLILIVADWYDDHDFPIAAEQWRFIAQLVGTRSNPRSPVHYKQSLDYNMMVGAASDTAREMERRWCELKGVRFIPCYTHLNNHKLCRTPTIVPTQQYFKRRSRWSGELDQPRNY